MKYNFTFLLLILLVVAVKVFAAPVITSFSPTSGTFHTAITINGSGFTNIYLDNVENSVLFGSQPADSLIIVSDNQIIAWVGGGASGSVIVYDKNGGVGSIPGFTYVTPALPNNWQWQQYGNLSPNNKTSYVCGVWNRHDAKPIIAYRDSTSKYAYAAEFSKQTNQMTVLGGAVSTGDCRYIKMIEDANVTDYPIVGYNDPANNIYGINIKHFNGASWDQVGGIGLSGSVYSMAIDNNNNLYVAASGSSTAIIVYKCNLTTQSPWSVVGSANFARSSYALFNIAVDKNSNVPYIVFGDDSQNTPSGGSYGSVMKYDGNKWVYVGKPGFTLGIIGVFTADIAIDQQGNPICSFQDDNGFQRASVFKYNNGAWSTIGYPNFSNGTAYPVSLALNAKGTPYIIFYDFSYNGRGTVMTYNNATSTWDVVGARGFLDVSRSSLQEGSVFLDVYDNPWIATRYGYSAGYASPALLEFLSNDSTILPAKPAVQVANRQSPDTTGWTHYYYDSGTPDDFRDDILLLSLKTTENIGNIGDGSFMVKSVATADAGSSAGIKLTNPLITNTSGYWVMNRYWQVTPTQQPSISVGVRFYYNNQDVSDVNGSYQSHNLAKDKLIFYKATGGNPDPTTNLAGTTKLIGILPNTYASDTTWTYHVLSDTTQYAEYSVASFSGGGGGATGDGKTITTSAATILPLTLLNFSGNRQGNSNLLQWTTSNEVGTKTFVVESSANGGSFAPIGNVAAIGGGNYSFTDNNPIASRTYYRLKMMDADGKFTYSNIIWISASGSSNISVYPNPVSQVATININNNNQLIGTKAQLTDVGGRLLQQISIGHNQELLNMTGLPAGLYLLKLNDGTVVKIMKQ